MLKKSDLAKQFELVVQQEITNYQNSLNFILQEIRDLKESIREVKEQALENHALIHSEHNKLVREFITFKDSSQRLFDLSESVFRDQRVVNERNALEMRDLAFGLHKKISVDGHFQKELSDVGSMIYRIKGDLEAQMRAAHENIDALYLRVKKDIQKAKEEVLQKPTAVSLLRKELEDKIYSHVVDVEGLLKEIRIIGRNVMVTEKKIENIYTLIDRIKKPEVIP